MALFMVLIVDVALQHNQIDVRFDRIISAYLVTVFGLDMVFVRSRVHAVQRNKQSDNLGKTASRYFSKYFICDITALVLYFLVVAGYSVRYYRILVFVKYLTIRRIQKQIYYKIANQRRIMLCVQLMKITFFLAFYSFFFGAVYVTIDLYSIYDGGFQYQNGLIWMTTSPKLHFVNVYEDFRWYVWFQYGLFMQLQMVRGCGYGTPSPRSPPSQLWYSISAITMQFLFAYSVGRFRSVFDVYDENLTRQKSQYSHLINYKKNKDYNYPDYIGYREIKTLDMMTRFVQCKNMMNQQLPKNLALQFNYFAGLHIIQRLSFLEHCARQDQYAKLKFELAQIIESKLVDQNQVIYNTDVCQQERLYFSDYVVFDSKSQQKNFFIRHELWSIIGMRQFLINKRSLLEVRASNVGIVEYISKQKFIEVFKKCKKTYRKFVKRISSIRLGEQNIDLLGMKCQLCNNNHLFQFCPVANIKLNCHKVQSNYSEATASNDRSPIFERRCVKSEKITRMSLELFLSDRFDDILK